MTALSQGLGEILFDLRLPQKDVDRMCDILGNDQLQEVFNSPVIPNGKKEKIIEELFDTAAAKFVKAICSYGCIASYRDILESYQNKMFASKNWLHAKITSAHPLEEEMVKKIKTALCEWCSADDVKLEEATDPSLLGGFVLTSGDLRYDQSVRGRMNELTKKLTRR